MSHRRLLEQWRLALNQADTLPTEQVAFDDDDIEEMIAVLASSAYVGSDIQNEYPKLWSQLMLNPLWQETFFAMLAQLLDEPPQSAASIDQTRISRFSHKIANVSPTPELRVRRNREWRVEWGVSAVQIQKILTPVRFPNQENVVYRRMKHVEKPLSLFRSEVDVISDEIDVSLIIKYAEGTRLLYPMIEFVIDEHKSPPSATLLWGRYEQTMMLPENEIRVEFPPVAFEQIGVGETLDELTITVPLSCVVTTYQ